jgi:hypothetical protein
MESLERFVMLATANDITRAAVDHGHVRQQCKPEWCWTPSWALEHLPASSCVAYAACLCCGSCMTMLACWATSTSAMQFKDGLQACFASPSGIEMCLQS